MKNDDIHNRKLDHLKIPLEFDVQYPDNYFKWIKLIHYSLPEFGLDEVDLTTDFFGKKISAPILIAGMTGGHPTAKKINQILAEAAEQENIILGIGSQRAGLENNSTIDSYEIVREFAPNIPIIGNIGIGQVSEPTFSTDDFEKCITMIKADVMAIHFNALHELIQETGNVSYKLFKENFQKIRKKFKIPIIAKETGTGFSEAAANQLELMGFDGFDVGGMGGTSFPAIECKRNNNKNNKYTRNLAEVFRDWGIPTPVSIIYVRKISNKPLIATGGLRNGLDIAKSIALGADIGGVAYNFLISAWNDYKNNSIDNTVREIKTLKNELRTSLWCMNIKNIHELKGDRRKIILLNDLYRWIFQKSI